MRRAKPGKRREALPGGAFLALFALAAATALSWCAARPPAHVSADANPAAFSAARARIDLEWIARAPHPVGSAEHERVRARLIERCRELGLETEALESFSTGLHGSLCAVRNVLVRLPGTVEGTRAVALCAHYDSVPAGPGAGDDGAGVAALLEIARALASERPLARPVWLVFTDGEEVDLSGASALVREPRFCDGVEVVVNLEARGTSGLSQMFETSAGNADLVRAYGRAVRRPSATSVAYEIYARMPNDTDLSVFKRAGLAGLNFAFIDGARRYHTPRDDVAHLDLGSVQHHGDQALALAREIGSDVELTARADSNRVYSDVFGLFFLSWSRALAIVLAAVALVCAALAPRGEHVRLGALGRASCAHIVSVGLGALAAQIVVSGLALVRGVPDPWAAHPEWTRVAVLAASATAVGLVPTFAFARRAGAPALAASAALGAGLAALVLAIWLPGASHLALAPALASASVGFVRARGVLSRALRWLTPLVAALTFGAPLVYGLELAFEFTAPALLGAAFAVFATLAAPLFAADRRARAWLCAPAFVALVSLVVALTRPTHSSAAPARLNFAHVEDRAAGAASFAALTFGAPLSEAIARAAPFEDEARPLLPWAKRAGSGRFAPAGAPVLEPPAIALLEESVEGPRRVVRVAITSARGATRFLVDVPRDATVRAAVWNGHRASDGFPKNGVLAVFGVGVEGFELEIEHADGAPLALRIADVASGAVPLAERILAARPEHASPAGTGDVSIAELRANL